MKAKYIVKISTYDDGARQEYCARVYRHFKCALDDVVHGSVELFDDIPREWLPKDFHNPSFIGFGSLTPKNIPDDLEIRYVREKDKWLLAYIGKVMIEDERR